ncbi:MAG: AGE family epimerase/isomerase, partial [Bacteroidales bacterium]|nr:AGE family epimerase/isomerase [Bacteroidales bacterium]
HSLDKEKGGYFEACTSDWQPIEDMRLSEKDANEKKTMNTHLHILEPYTNLLRALRLAGRCCNEVEKSHKALIEVFLDKILERSSSHLGLFFDENWVRRDNMVSYGHDIEASWLLFEAASVCGDAKLLEKVRKEAIRIAEAAAEGLAPDGSMYYEIRQDGVLDCDRHWWVQAETVVGYHYNYLLTGSQESASRRDRCLEYICRYLVDWENGEWWWSIKEDGSVNTADDKAGFWKCPYHNSRMCLELIEHTEEL